MKAVILAAGIASRLRPLTNDRPKCLLEIGGKCLLQLYNEGKWRITKFAFKQYEST